MKYTFIDLFSGAGGFSLGFKMAGYIPLLAIEKDFNAAETYSQNFNETYVLKRDIRSVHSLDIERILKNKRIDGIIASPPCEAFTVANENRQRDEIERLYGDPRGMLTLDAIRLIGDLQPDWFVLENVVGLMEGQLKKYLKEEFSRVGIQNIYFNVLNAENVGVPSQRRRVFISNVKITLPHINQLISVKEAFFSLPEPDPIHGIPNHIYVDSSKMSNTRISTLKPTRALVHYRGANKRYFKNYQRLDLEHIAPTVMGKKRFIHPIAPRICTVREHARLMSYPDTFVFYGSIESQFNQVGESVPPLLSFCIARFLKKKMKN